MLHMIELDLSGKDVVSLPLLSPPTPISHQITTSSPRERCLLFGEKHFN